MSAQAQVSWLLALALVADVLAGLRWLRVAQREHYLPGAAFVFARRWWGSGGLNRALCTAGLAGAVVSLWYPRAALAAVVVAGLAPIGLSPRGRTGRLAWTRRLRLLALLSALLVAALVGALAVLGQGPALSAAAFCGLGSPLIVDVALLVARPIEARLLRGYVEKATQRLAVVSPRVVAITGSYGKTTTKGYIAHLAGGSMSVVASPASFNNTAGLARAVNEHLATGTALFVAEMGTYGPGEIASMCEWVPPDIAVITALGPVHLERMGSIERIAEAKAEVLQKAGTVVLNVDHPLLAELAQKAEDEGKTVWRCSGTSTAGTGAGADVVVSVEDAKLRVRATHFKVELDVLVASAPGVAPGNVACAVAVALSLGVPHEKVASRLESLPTAPHRRSTGETANGVVVIDDTFNANPAGAKAALEQLGATGAPGGKRVVVTPGMVELGHIQQRENANFAAAAGAVADQLVVVGRTNARALLAGAGAAGLAARRARHREDAVAWVSANLGPGDAVLYENDLPDHYP